MVPGQKRRFRFQCPAWIASEVVLYCCADYLINIQHSASTVTMARLLQEVNSPGRVLKLREDQIFSALSDPVVSNWIDLNDSIGTMQVVLRADLEVIRWQVLKQYYSCTDEQAQAIADGGHEPLYGPSTLIKRVQDLKHARIHGKPALAKKSPRSDKSGLVQRMELSAALFEARMRGY
jgi:hypothetical protein